MSAARLRLAVVVVVASLLVVTAVLAVRVSRAVAQPPTETAEAGELVPLRTQPYTGELTVLLPGSEVTVGVGAPVDSLDHELLDVDYDDPRFGDREALGAPEGGSLVPLWWRTRSLGGLLRKADPNPIALRLVAGDQRVELDSIVLGDAGDSAGAFDTQSKAVAVDGTPGLQDLTVEVEYDGLTQSADVASGEVDAGVAQVLYGGGNRNFDGGCTEVDDGCELSVVDRTSPVRPYSASFTTSRVTLYPYDTELGWADEGTLWAGVRLQLFGSDGVTTADGRFWSVDRQGAPRVTLDGAEPVRREGLKAAEYLNSGQAVFEVEADAVPEELVIRQVVEARGPGAPAGLPVRARLDLTPVR